MDKTIPLHIPIVNGLPEGARVLIEGTAYNGSQRSFAVELYAGPNIALHLNPRFGHFNEFVTVLNSMQEGGWKHEERHQMPIIVGQPFKLKIKNVDNKYKIKINNDEMFFHHRIPPQFINGFGIRGDVTVQKIHFKNFHEQCFQPGNYVPPMYPSTGYNPAPPVGFGAAPSAPAYQPYGTPAPPPPQPYGGMPSTGYGAYGPPPPHPTPLNVPITNGLAEGARIVIEGSATNGPERSFTVALHAGSNIALQMSFKFGSENQIVLNSCESNVWKNEERQPLPFRVGHEFELSIKNINNKYRIEVDDTEFKFHHRVSPNLISALTIQGDISIKRVQLKNFRKQVQNNSPQPVGFVAQPMQTPYPNTNNSPPPVGFGANPMETPFPGVYPGPSPSGFNAGIQQSPLGHGSYCLPPEAFSPSSLKMMEAQQKMQFEFMNSFMDRASKFMTKFDTK
uniref:Galectin n=1 Tax=Syphacia muris TaxID=451379 RepID=A0A158R4P3_9BILA